VLLKNITGGKSEAFTPRAAVAKVRFLGPVSSHKHLIFDRLRPHKGETPTPESRSADERIPAQKRVVSGDRLFDVVEPAEEDVDDKMYKDVSAVFIFGDTKESVEKWPDLAKKNMPKDSKITFVQTRESLDSGLQDFLHEKNIPILDGKKGANLFKMLEEGVPQKEVPAAEKPAMSELFKVLFLGADDPGVGTRETFHNLPSKTDIKPEGLLKKMVVSGDNRFEVRLMIDEENIGREMEDVSAVFIFAKNVTDLEGLHNEVKEILPEGARISFVQTTPELNKLISKFVKQEGISVVDGRKDADLGAMLAEGVSPEVPAAKVGIGMGD